MFSRSEFSRHPFSARRSYLPKKSIQSLSFTVSQSTCFLDFSTYSVFTIDEVVEILPYLQSFDRFVLEICCGIVASKR